MSRRFEYPPELQEVFRKAKRLERWTIAYVASIVTVMFLAMGNSQAMKTAWLEDTLSFIPPLVFLISGRVIAKRPNRNFPYGYHRAVSIAFLCGALALFGMGAFLLIDSALRLLQGERPPVGGIQIFGKVVWQGWIMILALLWSTIPAIFLGLSKKPYAEKLHDKALRTDADMNKANWTTSTAAMLGVLGIGAGIWWADSTAAILISLDVLHDGYKNLKNAVTDLMDRIPRTVDHKEVDPLVNEVKTLFDRSTWIDAAAIRLREEGHVYFGEAFVKVRDSSVDIVDNLKELQEKTYQLTWRMFDLTIMPLQDISGYQESTSKEREE